jgi:hypothetical protein
MHSFLVHRTPDLQIEGTVAAKMLSGAAPMIVGLISVPMLHGYQFLQDQAMMAVDALPIVQVPAFPSCPFKWKASKGLVAFSDSTCILFLLYTLLQYAKFISIEVLAAVGNAITPPDFRSFI